MASLDKMEGGAVQAVGLVLVVAIAWISYSAYKTLGRLPTAAELMAHLKAMAASFFRALVPSLGTPDGGSLSPATLYTGTALGTGGSEYAVTQNETLDYQIPLETVN